jgi:RimJ/RimL family protein N-acetyltransferase
VQVFAARFNVVKLVVSGAGAGRHSRSSLPRTFTAILECSRSPPLTRALFAGIGELKLNHRTMPMLQTPRLRLRSFTTHDLDPMATLMADVDFMRFSLGVFTRAKTAEFLNKVMVRDRESLPSQFAVIFRENERLIGYCGFFAQIVDGIEELEIGYRIDPAYWNRGLATEAARAVRDYAFSDLRLPRVMSLIHPDNVASRRVAEKSGMTIEKETVFRGFLTQIFSVRQQTGPQPPADGVE